MRPIAAVSFLGVILAIASVGPVQAKGCLKGAAVGGVAGHMAGHHGTLGAAAGCAVGHHEATKNDERAQQVQHDADGNGTPQR